MSDSIFPEPSPNPAFDQLVGDEIAALMVRGDIVEIYVNDDGFVRYESQTEGKVRSGVHIDPERVRAIIEQVAGSVDKVVTDRIPSLSAEIRGYGCRFQGELPPIVRNAQFNIRKKATRVFTLDEYVAGGMLTQGQKEYLERAIAERRNILVVGGTGTGKTTFVNALLGAMARISPRHRIITLEDLPELQCPADDYSPMFTMQETGGDGIVYDMTRLLADCMRRSPDRIVVGEVRDKAAYTMLKAWNTGHPGGVCTVHANDAVSALDRIRDLALESGAPVGTLGSLIGDAIDVVVSIVHVVQRDGTRTRRVDDILEVRGYDLGTGRYDYWRPFADTKV